MIDRFFRQVFHRAFDIVGLDRKPVLRVDRLKQFVLLFAVLVDFIVELRFFFSDLGIRTDLFVFTERFRILVFLIVSQYFRSVFADGGGRFRGVVVSARAVRSGSGRVGRQGAHVLQPPQIGVVRFVKLSLLFFGKERIWEGTPHSEVPIFPKKQET
ncbi:hypothetical protein [Saccharibacillus brassicae]|uniref:hypothetical protein n=1 Tax=Saccharibacillus brassicae TaxID=2583377 RepID=UPI0014783686|nr:hypothetical protein [Saccharibacillus brassicae]